MNIMTHLYIGFGEFSMAVAILYIAKRFEDYQYYKRKKDL